MKLQDKYQQVQQIMAEQVPQEIMDVFKQSLMQLIEQKLESKALKEGDIAPDFTLLASDGTKVSLYTLLQKKRVVLSFFRGNWCPFCTTELNHYQDALNLGELSNITLIAISPQTVEFNHKATADNNLSFTLLSDEGNAIAEKYGIAFTLQENVRDIYKSLGADLSLFNGDTTYRLPIPATYVIGQDKRIIFAAVNTNYMDRADIDQIKAAL